MSEKCPKCGTDLIELRSEKPLEIDYSAGGSWVGGPDTFWSFYGYWCRFCEKMYEPHSKRWLEPWQSEEKNQLAEQVQSLSEKAKTEVTE